MSLSRDDITIRNIIKCSADAKISSAEIDLLLLELVFDANLEHRSISDIKNEVSHKYELLKDQRKKQQVELSKFEMAREQLLICKHLALSFKHDWGTDTEKMQKRDFSGIAYWYSNSYAKEALLKFEKAFGSRDEIPVDSFTAVCESTDDGNTLGIIPIINSNDGRLMSFYRVIDKYDLKISAVCKVENPDGEGFTKFALVGKHLVNTGVTKKMTVEFATNRAIVDVVSMVEHMGGEIGEITSVPFLHSNTECANYISITVDSHLVYEMWLYMYIFFGEVDFIGVYTEI